MSLKLAVVLCMILVALETAYGAPHPLHRDLDLKKSFAEFLRQDKELSSLLKNGEWLNDEEFLSRHVRQAEDEAISDEQDVVPTKEAGFFDRAAKFVMEVLQRFLKWINTDN